MKSTIALILALLPTQTLLAQVGRIPQKQTQGYAKLCAATVGEFQIGGLFSRVDPLRAWAEQGEGGGAMVIPEKKLTKKSLDALGAKPVPIGQLWLRKWTLVSDGKPAPRKKIRMVTVNLDDKDRPMSLYVLAVRKHVRNGLQLLVFAKDEEPMQILPLKKLEVIPELPLQLEWRRGEKRNDPLTLSVLGRFAAVLNVTRQRR